MDLADALRYVAVPLAAAVVGGLVVHFSARRRDIEGDRRRRRVEYVVSAYQALARSAQRDLDRRQWEVFEDALTDIVLFGTAEQVSLATQIMHDLKTQRDAPLDRLLLALRRDLRTQLAMTSDQLVSVPVVRVTPASDRVAPRLRVDQTFEAFDRQLSETRVTVREQHTPQPAPLLSGEASRLHELAEMAPGAAVAEAYTWLSEALAKIVGEVGGPTDALELAELGVDRGLVAPETARSVEGLRVLRALSHAEGAGTGLSPDRARDYIDLTRATIYALQSKSTKATQ